MRLFKSKFLLYTTAILGYVLVPSFTVKHRVKSIGNTSLMIYKDAKAPIEERVQDLLKRMTLEEKVAQMCSLFPGKGETIFNSSGEFSVDFYKRNMPNNIGFISAPAVNSEAKIGAEVANAIQKVAVEQTRLGIPVIIVDESLHGHMVKGATSFPQSLGLAATWNEGLINRVSTVIGQQVASRGARQVLSSVFDIGRDPRNGRIEETYGEDPYLASKMAVAYITGIQSNQVIATGKHFVADFVGDGGRDGGDIEFSERLLREVYFKPYEAAVKEGKLMSIMAAYNSLNGVPCSANSWLLNDVLRKEWGFNGIVVSDWSGLLHLNATQHVAATVNEAAVMGVKGGLDVDLPRPKTYALLVNEVNAGHIDVSYIDQSVARILTLKFKLGLFENPYVNVENAVKMQDAAGHRQLALEAARQSMVLLKNDKAILPLRLALKNIAVIGPNADVVQLGGYSASGVKAITPLQGIRTAFPGTHITYAKGCELTGASQAGFAEALQAAKDVEAVIMIVGGSQATQSETRDRIDLRVMGQQQALIQEVSKVNKNIVVVMINGGPVIMKDWIDQVPGVLMAWYAGEEGGKAIGEILSGKCNPSGKLPITFPLDNGQIPIYYNNRPYGREGQVVELPGKNINYRYYPQFPFGYGLSYTKFDYSNINCEKLISKSQPVQVNVDVQNAGKVDGEEVIQLYLSQSFCRINRPIKELIAYKKIKLKAGEKQTVTFTVTPENMSFLNEKLQPEIQPGEFKVMAGKNCEEGVTATFVVK